MVLVTSPVDLQNRIDDCLGYLANRDVDGRTFTVHDLAHFCNAKVEFTPDDYPKHWVEHEDELDHELGGREGEVWDICGNCRRRRESAQRRATHQSRS